MSRKDFQDIKAQYEHVDFLDIFTICMKPANLRTDFEKQAVVRLMRSCPFFSSMKNHQLINISDRLHSIGFRTGEKLIVKGEKADCLYLIVTGKVGIYIDEDHWVDEVIERNVIGEAAIQTRSLRTATVIAHMDVKALRLTYEDYDIAVFKIKLQDFYSVTNFLRSIEFFSEWNISKLYRLASAVIVKQYEKGQILYSLGEAAHDFFIVREGNVAINVEIELESRNRWPIPNGRWGESLSLACFSKTLRMCRSKDFFGEQELIEKTTRRAKAVCASPLSVLFILRDEYFKDIFSEKDQKLMHKKSVGRPNTPQLQAALRSEKRVAALRIDAMLDGFGTNSVPEGRKVFQEKQNQKVLKLAKMLVRRKREDLSRDMVRKQKTQRELDQRSPDLA